MIFLNKEGKFSINRLFDIFQIKSDDFTIVDVKQITLENVLEAAGNIFLFNPTRDELELIQKLKKDVICISHHIKYDLIEALRSENVKKIWIFSSSDRIMLENNHIEKYQLVLPATSTKMPKEKYFGAVGCGDELKNLEKSDVKTLIDLSDVMNDKTLFYGGLKVIENESCFKNLIDLLYNDIQIEEYKIFSLFEDLRTVFTTVSFVKNNEFPILSYYNLLHDNLPIVYSEIYYPWLDWRLQSKNLDILKDVFNEPIVQNDIIENNKLLREKYFSESISISEAMQQEGISVTE
jgi:hypothetical protein